ncbi:MAG: hypothetical protein CMA72_09355 [Euryarchaeota archaeon]|nr:hypothetical protein [Euryarchaeota archaeon]|tara:strand:- start:4212 stop:4805 length:594 start_codon:yes stop_codon:yes gene_type:complete
MPKIKKYGLNRENHSRFPQMDTRNDLGYGRTKLKFSKPRPSASSYPYSMNDEQEKESENLQDVEVEDVPRKAMTKVRRHVRVNDFGAAAGTDPFYYAGAATKISEQQSANSKGGIGVTLPAGIGSSTSGFRSITRPTGTKRGFSSAPYTIDNSETKNRLVDFVDDDDKSLRLFVRTILAKEKERNSKQNNRFQKNTY